VSSRGGETSRLGRNAPGPHLVRLAVAPDETEPDYIDEALDGLLMTVDDLVRDLDVEEAERSPFGAGPEADRVGTIGGPGALARGAPPPTVHRRAFLIGVGVVLIAFELVVLAWLLSNL
jgi:hypothetical protein